MAGASRYDLIEKAGMKLPDTFDELAAMLKAVNRQDGIAGFLVENHYGWTFIPFLQGFGGNVFRNPPDDLMPVLDTPEAVRGRGFLLQHAARLRAGRRAVLHLRPGAWRR